MSLRSSGWFLGLAYVAGCAALTTWLVRHGRHVAEFYEGTFSGSAPVGTSISSPVGLVRLGVLAVAALGLAALWVQVKGAARTHVRLLLLVLGTGSLVAVVASGPAYPGPADRSPSDPTLGADVWLAAAGTLLASAMVVVSAIGRARPAEGNRPIAVVG